MDPLNRTQPKYRQILEAFEKKIHSGEFKAGEKFPSEAELVRQFGASRITVGRAVRELQHKGLVERRAGSGTYISRPDPGRDGLLFGLLIPDLGQTEIFEPICQGMTRAPEAQQHALIWGNIRWGSDSQEKQAWQLCRQYIDRGVSGVFFAPLEWTPAKDEVNSQIAAALEEAGIPIILLDRCILPYPRRSRHDLVGIDNRRAGYVITEHLLNLGCRRIGFIGRPGAAPSVDARLAGYIEALYRCGAAIENDLVQRIDPSAIDQVRDVMERSRPEAFACANDETAGRLMHTLLRLGHRIPADVRIVGIDDVKYANLLPVPLTTLRQPCNEIGQLAMAAMLDRIAHPNMPARNILVDGELIVRQSCGSVADHGVRI